jgi:hypothetical protein
VHLQPLHLRRAEVAAALGGRRDHELPHQVLKPGRMQQEIVLTSRQTLL